MSLTLQIKYHPHKGQQSFHQSNARFRIMACGRRWGKTISGANETLKQTVSAGPEAVVFCVAPTYWHTQKQWREFVRYCPKEIIKDIHRGEHRITLKGDRMVWFKSADNPDSLRSEGLDFLWMDEGGQIKQEAWTLALRPALMDRHGRAIFTGTPKGKNWYFQLWTRGQDPAQTDYESWQHPSTNNPYLDPKEIEDFARDMPDLAYRQEILAQFIEDVGSVFRNVKQHIKGTLAKATEDNRYFAGCDLAKHEDFTVVCILRDDGQLVGWDRFSELDWVFQRRRIVQSCQQYDSRLLIDSTGVGDPFYDQLKRENIRVDGYKFTNATKADLIENLSLMLDNNKITYPDIPELISELELYGYDTTPSGTVKYGAPPGYHDDCVIALALAAWLYRTPTRAHSGFIEW